MTSDRRARGARGANESRGLALLLGTGALALAACTAIAGDDLGAQEQEAQPIDRLLIGRAARYPVDTTLRARAPILEASMAERRKVAWQIVEKIFAPVRIDGTASTSPADAGLDARPDAATASLAASTATALKLPRFQTWHAREEILPMFDRLFRALPDPDKRARAPFTPKAIEDVFPWNVGRATSLASFTEERLEARRRELVTDLGVHSLGKDTRVLMSPDYVQHLFESYTNILGCKATEPPVLAPGATLPPDPSSSAAFAPCLNGEFPPGAVALKTRWMPSDSPVPTYDTSPAALADKLAKGTFGDGDGQASPDDASAYTMQLTPDTKTRLVALHIMTKELRDWAWITLWWSPDADSDFGADRPASLTGPFANYKMCVVTAFAEKDKAPGESFAAKHPSLADALAATADGPATWCSNPYLETAERAAKTNCIGCHQSGGTRETTETILASTTKFPDFGRKKVRSDFPADYAFTTEGGLELAAEMRARAESLTPAPAPAPPSTATTN